MMNENRPHISYTLKLSELSHRNIDRAGAKAANLGELARKGFPVPDGFVLTTNAFDEFLAANAIRPDSSPEAVVAAVLPADVANALLTAAAGLGDIPLAVRSSGVAEDLSGASFAGQYETVLDVRGADALSAAVRRCWASVFSERVVAYRATQGQRGVSSMAVLVQRLVPADAAGVAFTANPVTGDRAETVVSAVKGLGDRLVSGQVSPDEWLVKGEDTICQRSQEDAIDAAQVRAVAELARRVEAHFGAPQDIEWAFVGGQLFLLQAAPDHRPAGPGASDHPGASRTTTRVLAARGQPCSAATLTDEPLNILPFTECCDEAHVRRIQPPSGNHGVPGDRRLGVHPPGAPGWQGPAGTPGLADAAAYPRRAADALSHQADGGSAPLRQARTLHPALVRGMAAKSHYRHYRATGHRCHDALR